MHHITEDTPPDMLAGAMDLAVRLPDGRDVCMSVERSTPMMDLLVQVTTAYKLRPSEHVVQALDMSDAERALPFKPNAPIGALETQRIRVLPKGKPPAPRVPPPPGHQPFESTFRLQVHLPRNQFCVIRVSKHTHLEDIIRKVCEEKNLDPRKYECRHPANIDKVLDPKLTLNDYGITEITFVHRGSAHLNQTISSSDIMVLQREEDRRKMQKPGGGVLNMIFRRGRSSMGSGSISSDTRSISPTQSDDSRSVTPPAVQPNQILPATPQEPKPPANRPKAPQRKRRPAPKPPSQSATENQDNKIIPTTPVISEITESKQEIMEQIPEMVQTKLDNGLTICHSRNSSDSSGYHEASILSDNCNTTLPRRPKSTIIDNSLTSSTLSMDKTMDTRKSTGNLTNMTSQSKSTMSLSNAGRKKKAPPPPPLLKSSSSVTNVNSVISASPVSVVASMSSTDSLQRSQDTSSPDIISMRDEFQTPVPKPRKFVKPAPVPSPRKVFKNSSAENDKNDTISISESISSYADLDENSLADKVSEKENTFVNNSDDDSVSQRKNSKLDNCSRERGFQIGKSMFSIDHNEPNLSEASIMSNSSSSSTLHSNSIYDDDDNLEIGNIKMFENKQRSGKSKKNKKYSNQFNRAETLAEIHDLKQSDSYGEILKRSSTSSRELNNNKSALSLQSFSSLPAFLGSSTNFQKWDNLQNLDGICGESVASTNASSWVIGDPSDTDSTCPPTPSDIISLPRTSSTSFQTISLDSNLSHDYSSQQSMSSQPSLATQTSFLSETTTSPRSSFGSNQFSTSLSEEQIEAKNSSKILTTNLSSVESSSSERNMPLDESRKFSVSSVTLQNSNSEELSENNVSQRLPLQRISNEEKPEIIPKQEKVTKGSLIKSPAIQRSVTEEGKEEISHKSIEISSKLPLKENKVAETKPLSIEIPNMNRKPNFDDHTEIETDWQYTLPSPPTAFRDSSPTNFTDVTNYDTVTLNGLSTDSVVTSPQLFEKLENIRSNAEINSETATVVSENESTLSEKILTSKYLSLETLEKRKSLVLERELTSLKIAQTEEDNKVSDNKKQDEIIKSQRDSLRNEIEEVIQNKSRSSTLSRSNSQSYEKNLFAASGDSMLPNFKITTYDQPKGKINIFEDDSVRSNVDSKTNSLKRNSAIDLNLAVKLHSAESEDSPLVKKRNSLINTSIENVYLAKRHSVDDYVFKKPQDVPKPRKQSLASNDSDPDRNGDAMSRSESFSAQKNIWLRTNPVKRSKSHISLDKYNKEENKDVINNSEDGLQKSNSLLNVSGLQSLEVMRMILPKLGNTPPSTPPDDLKTKPLKPPAPPTKPEPPTVPSRSSSVEKEAASKKYQYNGPPAINLGTWSERPKSQVSLKEDTDYKISNVAAVKSKFSLQTKGNSFPEAKKAQEATQQNYPSVNIKVNSTESKDQVDSGKINIKINSEPSKTISHQSSGNVIIKIGSSGEQTQLPKPEKLRGNAYSRFLNQTTASGYRKPLGNINGVDKPRPHSIAFDANCPDLSRVPIVRAVELKKPFKDPQMNKSVTQIIHNDFSPTDVNDLPRNISSNGHTEVKTNLRHSSVYLSSENLNKIDQNGSNKVLSVFTKPVLRGNSFATSRPNSTPVVKGFRVPVNKETEINETKKVASWSNSNNNNNNQYTTLPVNVKLNTFYNSNSTENKVPFSLNNLKRNDNSEKSIFETVTLRKTAINGQPFYRHSVGPTLETSTTTNGSLAPPPPPPQMPKITAVTKKSLQRQRQVEDPRDQLLDAIRSFGGKSGLRAAK